MRAHTVIVRSLRVVLALGFVGALGVVGLYLFGREGRPDSTEAGAMPTPQELEEEFTVISEGFEFALTRGDKVIFEISGDEQRAARDGRVFLENVFISMDRGDGTYQVEAQQALYNPRNQDSRLEGGVVLRGGSGLSIQSDWLRLEGEGREVLARGGVRFRSRRQFQGRSDELVANLDDHGLRLSGNVNVRTLKGAKTPIRMETEELEYSEQEGRVNARGGVSFQSERERLEADDLTVTFDPETREVSEIELIGSVEADMGAGGVLEEGASADGTREFAPEQTPPPIGGPNSLRMSGDRLHMSFDGISGDPMGLLLIGTTSPAVIEQEQADGTHARMHVRSLSGVFEGGVLTAGELGGPLRIVQAEPATTPRRAGADQGVVRFHSDTGQLATLDLLGEVSLSEEEIQATGDEAFIEFSTGRVEIVGDPARAVHAKGTLEMPRLVFQRGTGLVHAHQGVKVILDRGGEAIGGLSVGGRESEEPVYVEADEILLYSDPDSALFRGQVRAWQGTTTLFTDELRGSPEPYQQLAAVGNVRTLVVPQPEDDAAPEPAPQPVVAQGDSTGDGDTEGEADSEGSGPAPLPTGPMNITADEMTYMEGENRVVYRGSVQAVRDWAALECEELSVILDEETNEARQMLLQREVRIDDGFNKRVLEGERALYAPNGTEIELFGDPVKVDDGKGGMMEGGRHFLYDFETGGMRLTSREANVAP
ncbi:MAG: hypothetical protein VYE73_04695 [Acidobacteriota bacterium]|nr:hypothetical protein [Acidobacteriota bacterium]